MTIDLDSEPIQISEPVVEPVQVGKGKSKSSLALSLGSRQSQSSLPTTVFESNVANNGMKLGSLLDAHMDHAIVGLEQSVKTMNEIEIAIDVDSDEKKIEKSFVKDYDSDGPVELPTRNVIVHDDDEFNFTGMEKSEVKKEESPKPVIKKLKPSQRQLMKEKQALEQLPIDSKKKEPVTPANKIEVKGVQVAMLSKVLPPTSILHQYMYASEPAPTLSNSNLVDSIEMVVESEVWDKVSELRAEQAEAIQSSNSVQARNSRDNLITYNELFEFVKTMDLSKFKSEIVTFDDTSLPFVTRVIYSCFGPPILPEGLQKERDLVFLLAKQPLDYSVVELERMLQTIYRLFSGDRLSCSRYGSHWMELGFQGEDPMTDLRGSGIFGLLQLLHFVRFYPELSLRIYQFSKSQQNKDENFPFCLVAFNFTGILLMVLREAKLYSMFVQSNCVLSILNDIFAAIYYEFFLIWKNEKLSISDFSAAKSRIEAWVRADPVTVFTRFQQQQKTTKCEVEGIFNV